MLNVETHYLILPGESQNLLRESGSQTSDANADPCTPRGVAFVSTNGPGSHISPALYLNEGFVLGPHSH